MPAAVNGQFQFGADTIGTGNQQRLTVSIQGQFEECAKTTQSGNHAFTTGTRHHGFDAFHQGVTGVNIDAGVTVTYGRTGR